MGIWKQICLSGVVRNGKRRSKPDLANIAGVRILKKKGETSDTLKRKHSLLLKTGLAYTSPSGAAYKRQKRSEIVQFFKETSLNTWCDFFREKIAVNTLFIF